MLFTMSGIWTIEPKQQSINKSCHPLPEFFLFYPTDVFAIINLNLYLVCNLTTQIFFLLLCSICKSLPLLSLSIVLVKSHLLKRRLYPLKKPSSNQNFHCPKFYKCGTKSICLEKAGPCLKWKGETTIPGPGSETWRPHPEDCKHHSG